jgi:3-hydroxyisobutyrate dehydrogenase-like beta-hydroxyacid dehydrogenase
VSGFSRIALIGFGEVGQILATDLAKRGVTQLTAYDVAFADPDSAPSRAVACHAVTRAASAPDAVRVAELVISAVTADQDLVAAKSVGPGLRAGAVFLDLNSASPGQKIASAEAVEAAGGVYVEAAVMSPFPPKRLASPTLLGGPHAAAALESLRALGFTGATFYSDEVGKAAATKLCRSVMIKGIESLLTESMLAARHYGVEATVLASLSDLLPVPDWPGLARYMISRSLEHGVRRAEEMREAARTVAEAGLEPMMSLATAARQDWAADYRAALAQGDLEPMLDAINQALAQDRPQDRT